MPTNWVGYTFMNIENQPVTVIEDLGYSSASGEHKVIVRFDITGNTKEVFVNNVRTGKVKDPMRGIRLFEWRHSNGFGDFMIIEDMGMIQQNNRPIHMVKCQWKDTGSVSIYRFDHAVEGSIKDWYKPILFGIAYHGEVDCFEEPWAYQEWKHMLQRCYDKNDTHYSSYGGKNVYVDNRWLNYANFVKDIKYLENYDKKLAFPSEFEIDKDFLQRHVPDNVPKVYSPETCMFIHRSLNNYLRYNSSSTPIDRQYLVPMINLV